MAGRDRVDEFGQAVATICDRGELLGEGFGVHTILVDWDGHEPFGERPERRERTRVGRLRHDHAVLFVEKQKRHNEEPLLPAIENR